MASVAINVRNYATEIPGRLSDDRLTWCFPPVLSKNSHDRVTEWIIYVKLMIDLQQDRFIAIQDEYFKNTPMDSNIRGWIKVDSGITGGKVKKSTPTIVPSGKNLGKASATNVFCQALRDAYGLYNKQLKKSNVVVQRYPPMLAQPLKNPSALVFGRVFYQRKYNGVRSMTYVEHAAMDVNGIVPADQNSPIMYSRRKLTYPGFQYIKDELRPVFEYYHQKGIQLYLDGELYSHGVPLQDISGMARRANLPQDKKIDYMVYDCVVINNLELDFASRLEILNDLFTRFNLKFVKQVETFEVTSIEEINELYKQFLEEDYEGGMIRLNEPYRFSYNEYHSSVLLKMKPTHDAEFTIIGWETGLKGKAAGAIMMICAVGAKQFPVTPAMELPDRIALAKKMDEVEPNQRTHFENHWKGRPLIVYYDEMSRDGLPQRARTKMEIRTWD